MAGQVNIHSVNSHYARRVMATTRPLLASPASSAPTASAFTHVHPVSNDRRDRRLVSLRYGDPVVLGAVDGGP